MCTHKMLPLTDINKIYRIYCRSITTSLFKCADMCTHPFCESLSALWMQQEYKWSKPLIIFMLTVYWAIHWCDAAFFYLTLILPIFVCLFTLEYDPYFRQHYTRIKFSLLEHFFTWLYLNNQKKIFGSTLLSFLVALLMSFTSSIICCQFYYKQGSGNFYMRTHAHTFVWCVFWRLHKSRHAAWRRSLDC